MNMKMYAHYNDDGDILGFYNSNLHSQIPAPAIAITENQWRECVQNPGTQKISAKGKLIKVRLSMFELKTQTLEKVLVFASDIRAKVAGQVDQYKLAGWNDKSQRAQRVLAGNISEGDLAILQAECDQRGHSETPEQLATTQAKKGQSLAMAVAVIDGMEDTAIQSVEAATSEKALAALLEELQAKATVQLNQLLGD